MPARTTGKVTNGHLGYRDARELIDDAKREILEHVNRVDTRLTSLDEHGSRGLSLVAERVRVNESTIKDLRESVESLNLTRAEGKGRAGLIALVVSAIISIIVAFIVSRITNEPEPVPQVTPTVVVTIAPAVNSAIPPTPPLIQVFEGAVVIRPEGTPSAAPSSPTPSPISTPRGPDAIDVLCNTLPPRLPPQACAAGKRQSERVPLKILLGLPPALGLGFVLVTRRRGKGDACRVES